MEIYIVGYSYCRDASNVRKQRDSEG